jgi:ribonuclease E
VESLALSILRILEEEAMKENTERIIAQLPVSVATFLLNEKRRGILDIEQRQGVEILLLPNEHLETPDYQIERIRTQDAAKLALDQPSYQITALPEAKSPTYYGKLAQPVPTEEPAVKQVSPPVPAPTPQRWTPAAQPEPSPRRDVERSEPESLLKRIWTGLFAPRHSEPAIPTASPLPAVESPPAPLPSASAPPAAPQRSRPVATESGGRRRPERPAPGRREESVGEAGTAQQPRPNGSVAKDQRARGESARSDEQPLVGPESGTDNDQQSPGKRSTESRSRRGSRGRGRRGPGMADRGRESIGIVEGEMEPVDQEASTWGRDEVTPTTRDDTTAATAPAPAPAEEEHWPPAVATAKHREAADRDPDQPAASPADLAPSRSDEDQPPTAPDAPTTEVTAPDTEQATDQPDQIAAEGEPSA